MPQIFLVTDRKSNQVQYAPSAPKARAVVAHWRMESESCEPEIKMIDYEFKDELAVILNEAVNIGRKGCHSDVRFASSFVNTRHRKRAPSHTAKLSESDVKLIRELYDEGIAVKDLAEKFEISVSHTSKIVRGIVWRDG